MLTAAHKTRGNLILEQIIVTDDMICGVFHDQYGIPAIDVMPIKDTPVGALTILHNITEERINPLVKYLRDNHDNKTNDKMP